MHRDKDVTLGEDGYPNRLDNAPGNVFSLACLALKILRSIAHSPTRAIEHFQDDRTLPTRLFSGFHCGRPQPDRHSARPMASFHYASSIS